MHDEETQIVKNQYDVIVIGGGASGLMSAGRASELKAKILLLEKNDGLGVKLLITGGGRCNVTNAEFDIRKFLSKYKDSDKYLFSTFSQFGVKDTIDFFNQKGMPTKIEAENRVFPTSDSARSVWEILVNQATKNGVEIKTSTTVLGFELNSEKKITGIKVKTKNEGEKILRARKYILSTGGTGRPETGSTGDGFRWLKEIGHNVIATSNALVPIETKDEWVKKISGVTLQNIKITTYQNNAKQEISRGKILFTHFGVTGPTVLNMSKDIGELLKYGEVIIRLDLLPDLDHGMLNKKLQDLFAIDNKKKIKNSLTNILPNAVIEQVLIQACIDGDKTNSNITREERMLLIESIKNLKMEVSKLLGSDKAVVSSGGVDLDEVDFKIMQSKIHPNLYLTGDILNIDRPSGGYSLQLCWTTGYVAGTHSATSNL